MELRFGAGRRSAGDSLFAGLRRTAVAVVTEPAAPVELVMRREVLLPQQGRPMQAAQAQLADPARKR